MPLMNRSSAAYLYSDYGLTEIRRKYIKTGQDAFRHVLPRLTDLQKKAIVWSVPTR